MKITRKNTVVETTIREVVAGQVFEHEGYLYMKVFDADTEIYCPVCDEKIEFDDICLAVALDDGGLYTFNLYDKVVVKECEVVVE